MREKKGVGVFLCSGRVGLKQSDASRLLKKTKRNGYYETAAVNVSSFQLRSASAVKATEYHILKRTVCPTPRTTQSLKTLPLLLLFFFCVLQNVPIKNIYIKKLSNGREIESSRQQSSLVAVAVVKAVDVSLTKLLRFQERKKRRVEKKGIQNRVVCSKN